MTCIQTFERESSVNPASSFNTETGLQRAGIFFYSEVRRNEFFFF